TGKANGPSRAKAALTVLGGATWQKTAIDRSKPRADESQTDKVPGLELLAQTVTAHDDGAHGNQERDEQKVGRACGGEDAEIQDIAERGREHGAAEGALPHQ